MEAENTDARSALGAWKVPGLEDWKVNKGNYTACVQFYSLQILNLKATDFFSHLATSCGCLPPKLSNISSCEGKKIYVKIISSKNTKFTPCRAVIEEYASSWHASRTRAEICAGRVTVAWLREEQEGRGSWNPDWRLLSRQGPSAERNLPTQDIPYNSTFSLVCVVNTLPDRQLPDFHPWCLSLKVIEPEHLDFSIWIVLWGILASVEFKWNRETDFFMQVSII